MSAVDSWRSFSGLIDNEMKTWEGKYRIHRCCDTNLLANHDRYESKSDQDKARFKKFSLVREAHESSSCLEQQGNRRTRESMPIYKVRTTRTAEFSKAQSTNLRYTFTTHSTHPYRLFTPGWNLCHALPRKIDPSKVCHSQHLAACSHSCFWPLQKKTIFLSYIKDLSRSFFFARFVLN